VFVAADAVTDAAAGIVADDDADTEAEICIRRGTVAPLNPFKKGTVPFF